jgi:hypothetical protein
LEATVRKALATFGTGAASDLLALTLPTFREYADRHGYDVVLGEPAASARPASWGKIPLLRQLLQTYEFVLWVDADALILDSSVDLETAIPADAFQALAVPDCGVGVYPNCGVWALRSGDRAQAFLANVWAQQDVIDHVWWEQAAVMRLLGWSLVDLAKARSSDWDDGTFTLEEVWNSIPMFPVGYAAAKIRHYAGWTYGRKRFDMQTDLAQLKGQRLRWGVGVVERRARPVYWPALWRGPVLGRLGYHLHRLTRR